MTRRYALGRAMGWRGKVHIAQASRVLVDGRMEPRALCAYVLLEHAQVDPLDLALSKQLCQRCAGIAGRMDRLAAEDARS